ncbi:MAG: methylmalonyl-CoA epimerase [Proteobacteria bacterium]|nr:methylmalonyl-CoA epimerase [Pseudomonadota bacterium]
MILSLDHIAIAVPDLERAIRRFADDFGLELAGTEDVVSAKTSTAFFPVPGTRIELVHPLNGTGPIVKYLEKRGGGMHHLCFSVDDIRAEMARLTGLGYRFLSEEPGVGAHESLVAFIHPKSSEGVLIELVEHTQEHP